MASRSGKRWRQPSAASAATALAANAGSNSWLMLWRPAAKSKQGEAAKPQDWREISAFSLQLYVVSLYVLLIASCVADYQYRNVAM